MVDPEDFPDQPINRNVDGGDVWEISTQDSSGKQVVVTCNGEVYYIKMFVVVFDKLYNVV